MRHLNRPVLLLDFNLLRILSWESVRNKGGGVSSAGEEKRSEGSWRLRGTSVPPLCLKGSTHKIFHSQIFIAHLLGTMRIPGMESA